MKDEIKKILNSSYIGTMLNDDEAAERILDLFSVMKRFVAYFDDDIYPIEKKAVIFAKDEDEAMEQLYKMYPYAKGVLMECNAS